MGVLTAFWLVVTVVAYRRGQRSQWRHVGLFGVALCLFLAYWTLRGYTFGGPVLDVRDRRHS
jgi:hypothetical protein